MHYRVSGVATTLSMTSLRLYKRMNSEFEKGLLIPLRDLRRPTT
jgi:hypothetical protein